VPLVSALVEGTKDETRVCERIGSLPEEPYLHLGYHCGVTNVVLGAGLLIWGIVRIRSPGARAPKPSVPRALGLISLSGAGTLFALAAIADPAFVSLVVIAGRAERFSSVIAAHTTWTLVSHIPLVLVLAFALIVDKERIVSWVQTTWARISPLIARLVTGVVLLVGILFLLDALGWYLMGELFIPA
jgi:hypothetical protein